MARTAIAVQTIAIDSGIANVTWTNGDTANDHEFVNDGSTHLFFLNADTVTRTGTVVSVADKYGRTGDLSTTVNAAAGAQSGFSVYGPFTPSMWNQSSGKINLDLATEGVAANLKVAVVKFQRRNE